MIQLREGHIGTTYILESIGENKEITSHLKDLGFVKGTPIKILSYSGENLILLIHNSRIALNKEVVQEVLIREKTIHDEDHWVSLETLPIGTKSVIVGVLGKGAVKRRLMDMGLTKGVEVFIRKVAPFGDPIEVTIRGYELTLRKKEAESILVDPIEE